MRIANKEFYQKQIEICEQALDILYAGFEKLMQDEEYKSKYKDIMFSQNMPPFLKEMFILKKNELYFRTLAKEMIPKTGLSYENLNYFVNRYGWSMIIENADKIKNYLQKNTVKRLKKDFKELFRDGYNLEHLDL